MRALKLFLLILSPAWIALAADNPGAATTTSRSNRSTVVNRALPKPNPALEKWIGVTAGPIPDIVRSHLPNLPPDQGVMIHNIAKDSPAVIAGLERSDIILRVDGQPIGSPQDLQAMLNRRNFGTQARLDIIHKGAPKTVYCIVLEDLEKAAADANKAAAEARNPFRGLKGEMVSAEFSCTDADGRRIAVSVPTLNELGKKAEQDEEFRSKLQRIFDSLLQNPQGVTVILRPAQPAPANP
ncbi:MAG: PDZ domain-containing protein [Verrucomicrobiae bacterium]|nr:PDZ domain-containing protein [Verrucomicrobiae bacterium]